MDTESKQILRDLRMALDGFNRQAGSLARNTRQAPDAGAGGHGHGDPIDDWWSERKRDWDASAESMAKFGAAFNRSVSGITDSFKTLGKGSDALVHSFQNMSEKVFGGALISGFVGVTQGLTKNYQDLSESGARFSDSIFGLAKTALETGTSMEEAVRLSKRNATVASALANNKQGGLLALSAQVRQSAQQFGSFGYTVEGLDDLVGDYAETLRLQGRLDKMDRAQTADSMLKVAANADILAQAFGKSRKDILDTATAAMKDTSYVTRMSMLSAEDQKKYGDAFTSGIMSLAAQAGDAGKILSKMFSQTVAYDGNAQDTDAARELFNKVLPQGTELMRKLYDDMQRDPENAARYQAQFTKDMRAAVAANKQNLLDLVRGHGEYASQAQAVLDMYNNMKEVSEETLKKQAAIGKASAEIADKLTKVSLNLQNVWMNFSSKVLLKFLPLVEKPMEAIGAALDRFANSKGFDALEATATKLGDQFTNFINTTLLTDDSMKKFTTWVATTMESWALWISDLPTKIAGWQKSLEESGNTIEAWKKYLGEKWDQFGAIAKMVSDNLSTLGKVALGVAALWAAVKIFNFGESIAKAFMGSNMNIAARNVYVNGAMGGGGGGGGGGFGGGGGKGRLARGGLKIAGIAALGLGIYELSQHMGVFSGLFSNDQKARAEQTKAIENATQNGAAAGGDMPMPEVLADDMRRLLQEQAKNGDEVAKHQIEMDDRAIAARSAYAAGSREGAGQPATPEAKQEQVSAQAVLTQATDIASAVAPAVATSIAGKIGGAVMAGGGGGAVGAGAVAAEAAAGSSILRGLVPFAKGLTTFATKIPVLGAAVSGLNTAYSAYSLKQQHDAGDISDEEYRKGLSQAVANGLLDAIPGLGVLNAVTSVATGKSIGDRLGGAASDAMGGQPPNPAARANPANDQSAGAQRATPRAPAIPDNLEARIAGLESGSSITGRSGGGMDAMVKQLEEVNDRLGALLVQGKDAADKLVKAAKDTTSAVNSSPS